MPGSEASRPATTRLERRDGGDQAQHPQDAQRAQHAEGLGRRHQRDSDDEEIEHAPGIAEERPAVNDDARGDLDHEHGEDDVVEDLEHAAVRGHRRSCWSRAPG